MNGANSTAWKPMIRRRIELLSARSQGKSGNEQIMSVSLREFEETPLAPVFSKAIPDSKRSRLDQVAVKIGAGVLGADRRRGPSAQNSRLLFRLGGLFSYENKSPETRRPY